MRRVVDGGDTRSRVDIVGTPLGEEALLGGRDTRGGVGLVGRQASRVVVSRVLSARLLDVVKVSVGSGRSRELSGRELEDGEVELGKRVEVEKRVHRLGEDVKNTIEDHLRVGRDNITAVGETPGNGVQEPKEGEDDGGLGEGRSVSVAERTSGLSSRAGKNPPDVEDCALVH